MVEIIDQRYIGRLVHGLRSRYPVSKMVAYMLIRASVLPPLRMLRVLDLTFGQGLWWTALRSRVVVAGFDIRRLEWAVEPRCFIQQPAQSWRSHVDEIRRCLGGPPMLVAVDPPWQICRHGHGCRPEKRHYRASHAYGTPQQILESAADAAMYYGIPLLVHYEERWVPQGFHVLYEAWWRPFLPNVDRYGYRNWWGVLAPVENSGMG